MKLIIAEKPELGKAIANALPGTGKSDNGSIVKGDYTVIWAFGHLLTLKEPQDYDKHFEKWELSSLPIYFRNWEQKPKPFDGRGQSPEDRLNQIGALMKKADCVINAGDPDDEGQFLVDEIIHWCGYTGEVLRLNTSDTTLAGMQKALASMEPNTAYEPAGRSAYARSVADMIVGINLTRYFTINNPPATLHIGRVQSPTLGLVVKRDLLRESHKKVLYYVVHADLKITDKTVTTIYVPSKDDLNLDDGKITSKPYAQSKVDMLSSETLKGITVKIQDITEQPPLPFNLTELQAFCNRKFGYSLNDTMEITQTLRDKYQAITYNRSDCQYLNENQYKEAPDTMSTVISNIKFRPKELDMSIHSACFSNEQTEHANHTAIIPQNTSLDASQLPERERNVYMAICQYYMAQFMPPAKKKKTTLVVPLADGGSLKASNTVVVSPGYLVLFKNTTKNEDDDHAEDESASETLSGIPAGTYTGDVMKAWLDEKETKPPPAYTQGTLVRDMSRISKYVDDPEVKELLLQKDKGKKDENGSIGTVATRSAIIEGLISHGFLAENGKKLVSTELGRAFFNILPDELRTPDMTARWWVMQEDIKNGKADTSVLPDSVAKLVAGIVHTEYPKIPANILNKLPSKGGRAGGEPLGVCPRCGAPVVESNMAYGCSAWNSGCKFAIWKQAKGGLLSKTTITAADAKKLLKGEQIKKTTLLKNDGGKFTGNLVLDDDPERGTRLKLIIPDRAERASLGNCPWCGKPVYESGFAFGCSGYKDGCKFTIWKVAKGGPLKGHTVTAAEAKKLIAGGSIKVGKANISLAPHDDDSPYVNFDKN